MINNMNLDLKRDNYRHIRYNLEYLESYKEELVSLLDGLDFMKSMIFVRRMMMSQEIKSNNMIEGINDDLSIIDEVIKTRDSNSKRIINLYHGYQYIITHEDINKYSLKELYSLLSEGLLDKYSIENMGRFYRTKPVYILKGDRLDTEPFEGIEPQKIECYMNNLLEYINTHNTNSEIDNFIKSQIIHFYFVYIHPFFDVNGRTSRTLSMWFLLNNKCYPYIIFNRAIAFNQKEYEQSIVRGRNTGDITSFLEYMLQVVEKELEKEYLINNIQNNTKNNLSKEDLQILEYFLNLNGNLTLKDLIDIYNNYNPKKRIKEVALTKILPLIEKDILKINGYTKKKLYDNQPNMFLTLNEELISVNDSKIKKLKLNKYIR